MTLMPNGVPTAAGEYIHHLMHQHPLNIPAIHGHHPKGVYPVHLPQYYGPLGPFGHHMFYRGGLWRRRDRLGLGYGARYPYAHGFIRGPWYSSLRHGLGHRYHHRFRNALWRGVHFGHVPGNYVFHRRYQHGYGYGHGFQGYGHFIGEFIVVYQSRQGPVNNDFSVYHGEISWLRMLSKSEYSVLLESDSKTTNMVIMVTNRPTIFYDYVSKKLML